MYLSPGLNYVHAYHSSDFLSESRGIFKGSYSPVSGLFSAFHYNIIKDRLY